MKEKVKIWPTQLSGKRTREGGEKREEALPVRVSGSGRRWPSWCARRKEKKRQLGAQKGKSLQGRIVDSVWDSEHEERESQLAEQGKGSNKVNARKAKLSTAPRSAYQQDLGVENRLPLEGEERLECHKSTNLLPIRCKFQEGNLACSPPSMGQGKSTPLRVQRS